MTQVAQLRQALPEILLENRRLSAELAGRTQLHEQLEGGEVDEERLIEELLGEEKQAAELFQASSLVVLGIHLHHAAESCGAAALQHVARRQLVELACASWPRRCAQLELPRLGTRWWNSPVPTGLAAEPGWNFAS